MIEVIQRKFNPLENPHETETELLPMGLFLCLVEYVRNEIVRGAVGKNTYQSALSKRVGR